jgi:cystathionine beta-lyase/cystathionine gamma-synthase
VALSLHHRALQCPSVLAGVGAVPSPFDCYMTNRGMKTLHLRMERHAINAMALAKVLEAHDSVERVLYPGLPSHPQHAIAAKQNSGFGGMITFYIKVKGVMPSGAVARGVPHVGCLWDPCVRAIWRTRAHSWRT